MRDKISNGPGSFIHSIKIKDPGSCVIPDSQYTITLEEWKRQQEA